MRITGSSSRGPNDSNFVDFKTQWDAFMAISLTTSDLGFVIQLCSAKNMACR